MVMWMSAALAAIAFSLATNVRGETDHTATAVDDLRAYYLATGAIQRAIMDMSAGTPPTADTSNPDTYKPGQPRFQFPFPTGEVTVEIIPETAKLNINSITPPRLLALLTALGLDESRAQEVADAIVDWRTHLATGSGPFDDFYAAQTPSFHARHASFEEIEELLSVKGVTPDLFYGTYVRDTSVDPPRLVARGGLRDCLSVYGSTASIDVNGAAPAAMAAAGAPQDLIDAVIARRPFLTAQDFSNFMQGNPALTALRMGGNQIFTIRATARLRGPDGKLTGLRRTVAETVDFQLSKDPPVVSLRWYDRG